MNTFVMRWAHVPGVVYPEPRTEHGIRVNQSNRRPRVYPKSKKECAHHSCRALAVPGLTLCQKHREANYFKCKRYRARVRALQRGLAFIK